MRRLLPLLPALMVLGACQQRDSAPTAVKPTQSAPEVVSSAAPEVAKQAASPARKVSEENALYDFNYDYPAAAAAIPALRRFLDAAIERQRAKINTEAKQARSEAKANGLAYNSYYSATAWQVVAELPGWLSLSASQESYAGGAHPNHWFEALLWDKAAGKQREVSDLFTSKAALSQAIRKDFCAEIDKQRSVKRGEPVKPGSDQLFADCIDPVAQVVILGSSDRKTFNRIGVLVSPYEAGPYAEGDYEVTLPVTDAVLSAVKPEYRAAFSVPR